MLAAGSVSTVGGVAFIAMAGAHNPTLMPLVVYAATGGLDFIIQAQVFKLFNKYQLCGCGGSAAFTLGGTINKRTIDTGVRTNASHPALYQAFNPFTTTPVEGVHWAKSPTFGLALNRFAYSKPRTFRMTFGVRF